MNVSPSPGPPVEDPRGQRHRAGRESGTGIGDAPLREARGTDQHGVGGRVGVWTAAMALPGSVPRSERLPFTDEFFDYVTCADDFEHVRNDEAGFNEIHR